MSRLYHSYAGYLRSMQLSSTDIFVFVEGKQSDPYFYASVCASIPEFRFRYEICMAQQLPGATGGKQSLLQMFSYLRKNKSLVSTLGGQNTTCIFFLDKDVDDIRHKKKRSKHVIYTEHYDVQNYIFKHANLLTGASSAASVDPAILHAELNDAPKWCLNIAKHWREWISLCLHVLEEKINCEANYCVASRVQTRPCGPTDSTRYADLIREVANRHGLSEADFKERLAATVRKVDRYFATGHHHRIFKGKWFTHALADDIKRIMAGRPYNDCRLVSSLASSVAATLDFQEHWADYFRNPILNISLML